MFKRTYIIIALVILSFAAAATTYFVFIRRGDGNDVSKVDEAEALKAANRAAIEQVKGEKARGIQPLSETDHVLGKMDAPVKMVVFSDYECPFCQKYYQESIKRVRDEYGDKMVLAYRHFFISSHRNALPAALASECAAEQGKFWEMNDLLYAAAAANLMEVDQYKKDAASLGLDAAKFNECLDKEKYKDKIVKGIEDAKDSGIIGTPSSYVNSSYISGARTFDDYFDQNGEKKNGLKTIIEKYLQ